MDMRQYRGFMEPRNVAIVGASDDPDKTSGRTLRFLREYGFRGGVFPVNPRRSQVQGQATYRALAEIEAAVDLAVVVTPAAAVAQAVEDCVAREVPAVIAIPAGFAEIGEPGTKLQDDLAAVVRGTGTRVLGPNCIGLVNTRSRLTATMDTGLDQEGLELSDGGVAFVTQSGAIGSFVFNVAQNQGIGIGKWVSTGNEMDVTFPEMLRALVQDPTVTGVLGYIEGIRDGEGFVQTLELARRHGKPLGFLKVGRSRQGTAAVASHTGALAGVDEVYEGVFEQYGAARIHGLDGLTDWAAMAAGETRPAGGRVSIATLSGGAGALAADVCADLGLRLAEWDGPWHSRLAELLPSFVTPRNPMDLTGSISSPRLLEAVLRLSDEHPGTDVSLVILGNLERAEEGLVEVLVDVAATSSTPVVVVWVGGRGRALETLNRHGIPAYSDPGRALEALASLLRTSEVGRRPVRTSPPLDDERIERSRKLLGRAREAGAGMLHEAASKQLLALYGLPVVSEVVASDADDAATKAGELGFPVVVKLLADGVAHKTELGGVALDLRSPEDVHRAVTEMQARLPVDLRPGTRFLVQEMVPDGLELLLGVTRDPVFGPVLAVGLGGVLTEALGDVRFRVPPVSREDVEAIVSSLRGKDLFDELRGRPRRDREALARAVEGLSLLALELGTEVIELDINPLILGAEDGSSRVVDALVFVE